MATGTFKSASVGNVVSNYTYVSLTVELDSDACDFEADSESSVPECSITIQLDSTALAEALNNTLAEKVDIGAAKDTETVGKPVWSQMLRVRLQPQGPAPVGWPEVSFERHGQYHLDVVTFNFDTAVVPSLSFKGGSSESSSAIPAARFLQIEVRLPLSFEQPASPNR